MGGASIRAVRAWGLVCAVILGLVCARSAWATGPILFQTATMGTPGQTSGLSIYSGQWPAARFDVTTTFAVDAIGGHMFRNFDNPNPIFGALVKLSSDFDYPDSFDLSTPDVLRHVTFVPPNPSSDVVVSIPAITLTPGRYCVLFGSGLFGTTGEAAFPEGNGIVDPVSSFSFQPTHWSEGGINPISPERLTVYAVAPEPRRWLCSASRPSRCCDVAGDRNFRVVSL